MKKNSQTPKQQLSAVEELSNNINFETVSAAESVTLKILNKPKIVQHCDGTVIDGQYVFFEEEDKFLENK